MAIDYSAMYGKKKRAVDPNAPPRPTLLGHEKVIKDAKAVMDQQARQIAVLTNKVDELERKNNTLYQPNTVKFDPYSPKYPTQFKTIYSDSTNQVHLSITILL